MNNYCPQSVPYSDAPHHYANHTGSGHLPTVVRRTVRARVTVTAQDQVKSLIPILVKSPVPIPDPGMCLSPVTVLLLQNLNQMTVTLIDPVRLLDLSIMYVLLSPNNTSTLSSLT